MPLQKVDKIWMDGQLVDWDDARIHVLTHSLHYGCGVFEGIRAYATKDGPAVFRLKEHVDRLFGSEVHFPPRILLGTREGMRAGERILAGTGGHVDAAVDGAGRMSTGRATSHDAGLPGRALAGDVLARLLRGD